MAKYRRQFAVCSIFCDRGFWLKRIDSVGPGGLPPGNNMPDSELYESQHGGRSVRFMEPCPGDTECSWTERPDYMSVARWYPTLETLQDGSVMVIGGCLYGGLVVRQNSAAWILMRISQLCQ